MNGAEISTVMRSILKAYDKILSETSDKFSLSRTERDVLLFLHNNPGHDTARDIVEYRMIPKANVSQAVECLIAKGCLERIADTDDRRRVHLMLTEAGYSAAEELKSAQESFSEVLFRGFSPEERSTFFTANVRIAENVRKFLEE